MITCNGLEYFVDGERAYLAKLVSRKGRGKARVRHQCSPSFVPLALFGVGAVIKDGTKWTVELFAEHDKQETTALDAFLKINKEN